MSTRSLLQLVTVCCLLFHVAIAQESAPTASPSSKGFTLGADNLGQIASTVNLFTGDLNFPLTLVNLPGRNGLNVDVTLTYNSGTIDNRTGIWNLEAPTGVVGLGWSFDVPKIICDTKQTGTREDDQFFLVTGGSSTELVRTTNGVDWQGSYWVFEARPYQFWRIRFYYDAIDVNSSTNSGLNKWEIVREDGIKYVYGDRTSTRNTVQYCVRWGNWIGSSSQTSGQTRLAVAWNLSEIENLVGEKILYKYQNVEQFVGSISGQLQTEASYLSEITDVIGRKVQFVYKEKLASFFAEPHTEQPEPDAYQEVYERKYLETINVLTETGLPAFSVNLKYSSIDFFIDARTAKMTLAFVEEVSATKLTRAAMQFEYYNFSEPDVAGTNGALKKIINASGGSATFAYAGALAVGHGQRDLTIQPPPAETAYPNGFSEPQVWFGEDYVIVAWRSLGASWSHVTQNTRDVKIFVYQWIGEWKVTPLEMVSNVAATYNSPASGQWGYYNDFNVTMEKDFFAILAKSNQGNKWYLYAYSKNPQVRGDWIKYYQVFDNGVGGSASLLSGENFLAVMSYNDDSTHPSHLYSRIGGTYSIWNDYSLDQTTGEHFYTSGHNYLFSHNRERQGHAELNFTYLTADRKWMTSTLPQSLNFGVSNLQNNKSYWHGGNSFLVAMANNNPEFIYRWDNRYLNFYRDDNFLSSWSDDANVFIVNNSTIGIYDEAGNADEGIATRFDGATWHSTVDVHSFGITPLTFGDDYFLWRSSQQTSPIHSYQVIYNPNTNSWTTTEVPDGGDPIAGVNYFNLGGSWFRGTNGIWTKATTSHAGIIGNNNFMVYGTQSSNVVQFMKNGDFDMTRNISGSFSYRALTRQGMLRTSYLVNGTAVVTFSTLGTHAKDPYNTTQRSTAFIDATSLTLYRPTLREGMVTFNVTDSPVTRITVSDGIKDTYTSFDYDYLTSTTDAENNMAQYLKVTVLPGMYSADKRDWGYVNDYGYTTTYFHNGLTAAESGLTAPADGYNTDFRWAGSPFRVKVYDKNNNIVSTTENTYETFQRDLKNNLGTTIGQTYYVRKTQSKNTTDGILTVTTDSYDSNTGMLLYHHIDNTTSGNYSGTGIRTDYTYWWQKYDPTRARNIFTGVIQITKRGAGFAALESQITRYKNWPAPLKPAQSVEGQNTPGPYDSYVWKGTGDPTTVTQWDVTGAAPSSDWTFIAKTDLREGTNNVVTQTSARGGVIVSTIWDQYNIKPYAQVSGAKQSDVAYAGFEDSSNGNWSITGGVYMPGIAKTGNRSYYPGTLTKPGLDPASTYLISFWAKSNSGSLSVSGVGNVTIASPSGWSLFEYKVTGISSVSVQIVSGSVEVDIDDIKIYPVNAAFKSFTYDPRWGVSSETNNNNLTTYTEYDDWGRVRVVRDDSGNIIKLNTYNTKK